MKDLQAILDISESKSSNDDNSENIDKIIKEKSEENINKAKEYVVSLELKEKGFSYIEDACLKQLDEMKNDEKDGYLKSYTVYVPKETSASVSYFGTYSGRDFYYNFYSSYTKELRKTSNRSNAQSNWNNWIQGLVSLIMCFADWSAAVPFTMILTAMNAPSSYEVATGAYVENVVTYSANCRGIYTYDTLKRFGTDSNALIMLYTNEKGIARPQSYYHPVNPLYENIYSITPNAATQTIKTSEYDSTNMILSTCYTLYSQGRPDAIPRTWTLQSSALSLIWE